MITYKVYAALSLRRKFPTVFPYQYRRAPTVDIPTDIALI